MRGCNCGTTHQEAHAPGCAGFAVEYYALQADNDSFRAEVERLKKLTDKPAWWTQVQRENDVLRAEVERLTSELASEREVAKKFSLASQALETAEAEVERLRTKGEALAAKVREIQVGKTHEDNAHPLGADKSMAIRFMSIVRAALAEWEKP